LLVDVVALIVNVVVVLVDFLLDYVVVDVVIGVVDRRILVFDNNPFYHPSIMSLQWHLVN
jgi:hypothetical protein